MPDLSVAEVSLAKVFFAGGLSLADVSFAGVFITRWKGGCLFAGGIFTRLFFAGVSFAELSHAGVSFAGVSIKCWKGDVSQECLSQDVCFVKVHDA